MQIKEGDDFHFVSNECSHASIRLKQIEDELGTISAWKLIHETDIEAARSEATGHFEDVTNKIEDIDHTLRQTQRVNLASSSCTDILQRQKLGSWITDGCD